MNAKHRWKDGWHCTCGRLIYTIDGYAVIYRDGSNTDWEPVQEYPDGTEGPPVGKSFAKFYGRGYIRLLPVEASNKSLQTL